MTVSARPRVRGVVGDAVVRPDGVPKVRGEFQYASDLWQDGMLHGATLRSPHPHARIRGIDTARARALPGVRAVLTHADLPTSELFGLMQSDQHPLARAKVRFAGDPVALVAADDAQTARDACALIAVDYEPLPVVTDPIAALQADAPPIHDRGNVIDAVHLVHGDPAARAEVEVTGEYEVGMQDQAALGPEAGLAIPDDDGGVTLHIATQWLHEDLRQIAPCLGLPEEKVRLVMAGVGGAFGAREDVTLQIHACLLALATKRPVRMTYGREESFYGHVHRHPARLFYTHGARRDGTLVFVRATIVLDGGAYASSSPAVIANAACFAAGPYRVPNAEVRSVGAYTNNPPTGAMRGFGAVQTCFAGEAQMDRLAEELGIDPVELRLLNALEPGDRLPTGQLLTGSLPTREVIRRAAALAPPEPEALPRDPIRLPGGAGNTTRGEGVRRGLGFAVGFKNICFSEGFDDFCAARVVLREDGGAVVHCAAAEVGQGVTGVALQVARTELGTDDVTLAPHSTAGVGSAGSASASRLTWMVAGAVRDACRAALEEREQRGGGEVDVERVYRHPRTTPLDPETGQVTGERAHVALAVAAMRVAVEVDVELGLTRVVWIGTSQDVGAALNPQAVEGQIEGGTAQGLGLALMEEIQTRGGRITNASFTDYLIPTALDMPPVEIDLVEDPEPDAPYGVKGVGEPPTVVSTAAIVAALRDATGRPLTRVPVSPDDVVF